MGSRKKKTKCGIGSISLGSEPTPGLESMIYFTRGKAQCPDDIDYGEFT